MGYFSLSYGVEQERYFHAGHSTLQSQKWLGLRATFGCSGTVTIQRVLDTSSQRRKIVISLKFLQLHCLPLRKVSPLRFPVFSPN
ncbi:putative oxidoreductase YxbG [Fusarium oxysporum f. sp. albedinis]|nr:putative oxidoreductase YxbG [Fusarium oxysporum f. sp. albedinis]